MNTELIEIVSFEKLDKGKRRILFETGERCVVYYSEIRGMHIEEGAFVPYEVYTKILKGVVGKRAKKRALHLLEQMDRTERQLREKLQQSEYPDSCIDDAIEYVKKFHYLDDERYAENFTRYKKERMSRQQIKQKLMTKGLSQEIISNAIDEEYDVDEKVHIRKILED